MSSHEQTTAVLVDRLTSGQKEDLIFFGSLPGDGADFTSGLGNHDDEFVAAGLAGWFENHDDDTIRIPSSKPNTGWFSLTDQGQVVAQLLRARRRAGYGPLACLDPQSAALTRAGAVYTDRLNGATWDEIAGALNITVLQAMNLYVEAC